MKRILLTLLAVVVVLGLFAAVGYTGYRVGYSRGAQGLERAADGDDLRPGLRAFDGFGRHGIFPGREFGFGRGFERRLGGFPMVGFGFFPLLGLIAVLTLLALFVYWLFTRSGWRVVRTIPVAETPPPTPPAETEAKE